MINLHKIFASNPDESALKQKNKVGLLSQLWQIYLGGIALSIHIPCAVECGTANEGVIKDKR